MTQSRLIDRFHARYPKLRVEFVTSDHYLDLSKGKADVAFRSGDTDDELVDRKIADWRLLTHTDLRHTLRISAFFDFIIEERECTRHRKDCIEPPLRRAPMSRSCQATILVACGE